MALPTSKQEGSFEAFDEGTYEVGLKGIYLELNTEFESSSFNNGEGLRFQGSAITWDVDGTDWTERFVRLSTAGNAKFFNRLSALLGRDLTVDDKIEWGLAEDAQKNHPIDQYYQLKEDDPELGKKGTYVLKSDEPDYSGVVGNVTSLKVNGEEMLGRSCFLKIDKKANGYNAAKAGAASPLPKKSNRSKPQPVEAPAGAPT